MANIVRKQEPRGQTGIWDPFRMMRQVMGRDFPELGSLLDVSPFREFEPMAGLRPFSPDIEVKETSNEYKICVDVPGMKEEDVDIALSGNRLTISGKREEERREEGEQLYVVERSYGSFSRSFTLPPGADLDNVKADLREGVLRVDIPKRTVESARRIAVGGAGGGARGEQRELREGGVTQEAAGKAAGGKEQAPQGAGGKPVEAKEKGQKAA